MTTSELTRIERKTLIRAPRSRVWRALTTPAEFSKWFRATLSGEFEPGNRVELTSTHESAKGVRFEFTIERMEPETTFSWRWPSSEPDEPSTLVVFQLEEVEGGTMVTVVESGFEKISLARRARAFKENEEGWRDQMASLARYVGQEA